MEAVVFCVITGLAAYCVSGILQADGGAQISRPSEGALRGILLVVGGQLERIPVLVDALAGLAAPLHGRDAGSPGLAGGAVLKGESFGKGADAAVVLLLMGAGLIAGGVLSLSVPGALVGAGAPAVVLAVAGERARKASLRELEHAMPEAFGALAIALGSGHSMAQAMRYVGAHSKEPIRSEFMRVGFAIDCGFSASEALDALMGRLRAPGLDMVALALKVSQRTGAPLKDLLSQAARLVGDRIELERMLDVKTSQARMSARLVAGMPVAMIACLTLLSSDFRKGVATVSGAFCVLVALALNAVAWVVIRKIMKVEL